MINCPKCKGTKEVAPLGGIKKPCLTCNGKGTIEGFEPQAASANLIDKAAKRIKRDAKVAAEAVAEKAKEAAHSFVDEMKDASIPRDMG